MGRRHVAGGCCRPAWVGAAFCGPVCSVAVVAEQPGPGWLLLGSVPQPCQLLTPLSCPSTTPRALDDFEGTKKSCRRKLKRHNERRRVEFLRGERDSEAEEVGVGSLAQRGGRGVVLV